MKNRSVSVTGATGFVGWHVAEAFRSAGWRVRAIVRPGSTKPLPDGVESREAAFHPAALKSAIAGSDLVVHAAGLTRLLNEDVLRAVNVDGTRAMIGAVNDLGTRLALISSQAAAGTGTPDRPSREDDAPRPLTPYGRTKLAAENLVRAEARVPWTIVRPSAIYGPRDRQFLPLFRTASRGWFPLAADPRTAFTLIHVDDAARGVMMAGDDERAIGGTFFLGHASPQTAGDILKELARLVGRSYKPFRVPGFLLRTMAAVGDIEWRFGREPLLDTARMTELDAEGFVCAVDRARDVLGFTAETALPDGLARTLQWYRERGWI